MMLIALQAKHMQTIVPQAGQRLPPEHLREALEGPTGHAWTGIVDGKPIGCAGVLEVWPGRGYAWALLDQECGPHLLAITRAVRAKLMAVPFKRIEMAVDADFENARRWARMLGFVQETPKPMRAYTPDGRAAYLYALVKDQ
jgi:hypothetical protein